MTEHRQPQIANSLQEIIAFVESLEIGNQGAWFRGHSDSSFELLPSVFRRTGKNGDGPYYNENELLREFLRRHPTAKKEHSNTLELLTYAQHYGLPTRLLDWTENLLVAIYFACNEFHDSNGELIIKLSPKFNRGLFSLIGGKFNEDLINLSIETNYLPAMVEKVLEITNKQKSITKYIFINEHPLLSITESNFNELFKNANQIVFSIKINSIDFPHTGSCYDYHPPLINKRLITQSGCFTVHSGKILDGVEVIKFKPLSIGENRGFSSIIIYKHAKQNILRSLKMCGIDKSRLFPELEHQTAAIKDLCKY